MRTYVRYSDDLETIAPDEAEVTQKVTHVMSKGAQAVHEKEGRPVSARGPG